MPPTRSFTGRSRQRKTKRIVRLADGLARAIITVGGIGTIAAVSTVFVFLVWVVWPLFLPARVGEARELAFPGQRPLHLAIDEHQVLGWSLDAQGSLRSFRLDRPEQLETKHVAEGGVPLSAAAFALGSDDVALGFADGTVRMGRIRFLTRFLERLELPPELQQAADQPQFEPAGFQGGVVERTPEGQFRLQQLSADLEQPIDLDPAATSPVVRLDCVLPPAGPVFCALTADGKLRISAVRKRKNMLTGKETATVTSGELPFDQERRGPPDHVLLSGLGDNVYLLWKDGHLSRFETRTPSQPTLVEELDLIEPAGARLTAVTFLLGRNTLVTGDSTGRVRAWFRVLVDGAREDASGSADDSANAGLKNAAPDNPTLAVSPSDRLICAHDFPPAGVPITSLAASTRTRLLSIGLADGRVRLVHVTSHKQLAEMQTGGESPVQTIAMTPRDDGIAALAGGQLHRWQIDVRHPEVTLGTLFFPVWYEGYDRPMLLWQSSSGSQAFEPKFGLRPLIFGTLKATVYSMLFGAPLALLAAVFTSEFLHPRVKSKIKPTIELMASLPSVVLGFLAALVFAPLVAQSIPAVLSGFVTVPVMFLLGAHLWQLLPQSLSLRLARWRFVCILAMLPIGIAAAYWIGPGVERWLFAGDIRLWLDGQTGNGIGGWLMILLPLCGVATIVLGREVNTQVRAFTADWSRSRCAMLELLKFAAWLALAFGAAWLLAALLTAIGWDPRGSYLGTYDQRNTLIVGVVMGFAIIPLIYTIAEDALSTVPDHLRSASLGAGATPWQTATRIVIPIASSGLFTALMIGLGRAVGETMIVLMAAGNTPVTDWNVFNGLRSLSANIASELPEAPVGSTHYRTLFFAALCLFVITFLVNTLAEVVRLRFRRRTDEL